MTRVAGIGAVVVALIGRPVIADALVVVDFRGDRHHLVLGEGMLVIRRILVELVRILFRELLDAQCPLVKLGKTVAQVLRVRQTATHRMFRLPLSSLASRSSEYFAYR